MRVLLINPPFFLKDAVSGNPSMMKVLNIVPPLGLAYLAAVLRSQGHKVSIVDGSLFDSFSPLAARLRREGPELVGITATTPVLENAKETARIVRRHCAGAKIVIGGPHVTALPEETMADGCFDVGVLGEGEETLLELVSAGADLNKINGIAYRCNGAVVVNKKREFIKDLDTIPFPTRDLLPPLSQYSPTPASYRQLPLGVVMTSRGCPLKCTFCDRAIFGTTHRCRSIDNVLAELEELISGQGAREVRFFDDTFTLKKDYVLELCRKIQERKINISWTCLSSAATADLDVFRQMRKAGCWQILFGLESGDDRMLKLLGKGNTVSQNERAVRLAKQAGLEVRADFIVGTPGETKESLQRTLDFALGSRIDYAHFNKFVPYPGTELYKTLISKGYKFDFSQPCSIVDWDAIHYVPESMTKEEFRHFLDIAEKSFYLRPGYIMKRILALRTWTQLKGHVRGFWAMYNS